MNALVGRARKAAFYLLEWWVRELISLVPGALRELLAFGTPTLVVRLASSSITCERWLPGKSVPLATADLRASDENWSVERFRSMPEALSLQRAQIIVSLPPSDVLHCSLSLPIEAEWNLAEVLEFEMDRHTPFKADDVVFDYLVAPRRSGDRHIEVDLFCATKSCVARAVRLVTGLGLQPSQVTTETGVAGGWKPINLLPQELRTKRSSSIRYLTAALTLLAILLSAAAIYLPLQERQAALAQLQDRLSGAKEESRKALLLREEIEALTEESQFLLNKRHRHPRVLLVLTEVTELFPDHTWVVRFGVSESNLSLSGFSKKASGLIGALEGSTIIADARFSGPIVADREIGLERFDLHAVLSKTGEEWPPMSGQ